MGIGIAEFFGEVSSVTFALFLALWGWQGLMIFRIGKWN